MGVKYKVNEEFFDKWNPEMAYVLGYLYADGSLEDASYLRGKYMRVTSTDKATIVKIKSLLNSEHKIVDLKPRIVHFKFQNKSYKTKQGYLLRIGSHAIYQSLINLGLYPNKSLTIKFPVIPTKVFSHFVRGYFDGDGCVYLEMGRGIVREKIVKRLSVIFISGSIDFLTGLQKQIEKTLKLTGRIYYGSRAYRLQYTTGGAMKFFPFLYLDNKSLFLQRKFDVFVRYFELRPGRIDESIRAVFKQHGHVAK